MYIAKYIHSQGYRASYLRQIRNVDVRIRLIPKRENPPTITANKVPITGKLVAVTLITERRLESQGNRQKTDSTVREAPEQGLVNTGFEQESGIQSVQRKVEGVITSMGNTRAVRDFFQDTMSRSFFTVGYWHRILHGKCLQPAERNRLFEQD